MALQPSLRPQVIIGPYDAPHTLDIFCANLEIIIWKKKIVHANQNIFLTVDYVCPFRFDLQM